MRARPREINIFNMSLLDILCGALGAFCFMMLTALPHYVPPGSEALVVRNREETQRLLKEAEQWKSLFSDPAAAAQLQDLLDRLSAQLKQMEGQVNKYANDNAELKTENEKLTDENTRQATRLEQKKPFLIVSTTVELDQSIEVFLTDDMPAEKTGKSANAIFDPLAGGRGSNWLNDIVAFLPSRGAALWMTSEVHAGAHYKIYLRLANDPAARKTTVLNSTIFGSIADKNYAALTQVTVSPARFWDLLGVLTIGDDYKPVFREATEEEREAEWQAIMKTPRPALVLSTPTPAAPPVSTSPPAASPGPTLNMAEMERIRRERLRQQSPSGGTPASRMTEEEARALRERLRGERIQSTPVSSPPQS